MRGRFTFYEKSPDGKIVEKITTYLFAELERPGKSEFFEHWIKKPIRPEQRALKVYQDIQKTCENGNIWVAKDYDTELERRSLDRRLNHLLELGKNRNLLSKTDISYIIKIAARF